MITRMEFSAFGPSFVVSDVGPTRPTSNCGGLDRLSPIILFIVVIRNVLLNVPILRVIECMTWENGNRKSNGEDCLAEFCFQFRAELSFDKIEIYCMRPTY